MKIWKIADSAFRRYQHRKEWSKHETTYYNPPERGEGFIQPF